MNFAYSGHITINLKIFYIAPIAKRKSKMNREYSYPSHHETLSEDKVAYRNIKTIMANLKTFEYKISVIEDLLRNLLEEINETRETFLILKDRNNL